MSPRAARCPPTPTGSARPEPPPGRHRGGPTGALAWLLAAALAASTIVGCAPWYRDAERRGLQARDTERLDELVAEGDGHLSAGRAAEAEQRYAEAAQLNPRYLPALRGLVRALTAQGRDDEALAVARFAVEKSGAALGDEQLRKLLYDRALTQGLYGVALEYFGEGDGAPPLSSVVTVRELAPVYGKLAEAHQLAERDEVQAALERYAEWLADYGIVDQRWLRQWSDEILEKTAPLVRPRLELAEDALVAGNPLQAVLQYALAYRYLPSTGFDETSRGKLAAAAARIPDPATLSFTAADEARTGSAALAQGRVGEALGSYRRAVAAAPYWAAPRYNLALVLGQVGLFEEAVGQMEWYLVLAPRAPNESEARQRLAAWKSRRGATP